MKSKADLFQLIKAMSKSEKRYFTLDAQKSGRKDARYLELFQCINEQETYDEAPLKAKFGKTLPTDKAYLYEAILRSMRDYRSANSYAAHIKEMIMDAKYLYERGLYDQSEDRLNAAKELADELGDQLSVLELNKERRRLLKDTKPKGYEHELQKLIIEKEINLRNLNEELSFLDLHDRLLLEIRKNPQRLEEQQKTALKEQFHSLIELPTQEPSTIQGKLRYYQCMALFYQLLGNSDEVFRLYSKIVTYWNTSPKYKEEEFYRYILDVSNLLQIAFSDPSKLNYIPQLLTGLEAERPSNVHDQKVLFQKITSYRLIHSINTGDFSDVQNIVRRIDKGLKQYDIAHGSEIIIIFNVAVLLFMAEHFSMCQDWAGRIINYSKTAIREDIHKVSRLLFLIATLESGDFEEIENCIRSTARFFQKLSIQKKTFETTILQYVKKIHLSDATEAKQSLKQLRKFIFNQMEAKVSVALGLDELILYWTESRITKEPIAKLIKTGLPKSNN